MSRRIGGLVAASIALTMCFLLGSTLWAVEVVGLVGFALLVRPGGHRVPNSVLLDLLVAWPSVTVAVWAAVNAA